MEKTYQARRQKLRQTMAAQGIKYAVINDPLNVYYLCGAMYHPRERFLGLVIDAASEQCPIVLPEMEKGRLSDPLVIENGHLDGQDHMALLAGCLKSGAKIGIEKGFFSYGRAEALVEKTQNSFENLIDVGGMLHGMRLTKDALEIELLQKAAKMTDDLVGEWSKCIKVGAKESEMMFELIRLVALTEDADFSFGAQVSSGINTSIAHGIVGEREVLPGEQVLIDFGVMYKEYHADITRVFFPSEPDPKLREIYEIVLAANKAGIAAAKPGIPAAEVDKAARKVIEDAGYGEYFTHRTGHGIGLDVHEAPDARGDNLTILEPGMTFTVEPGIYIPGFGGARVEDDVLITAEGSRTLTAFPKEFDQVRL